MTATETNVDLITRKIRQHSRTRVIDNSVLQQLPDRASQDNCSIVSDTVRAHSCGVQICAKAVEDAATRPARIPRGIQSRPSL